MLTEQLSAVSESPGADGLPIGFITTDDGGTLVAVTEHDSGILEIMTTPVTFMQQNDNVSPSVIKTMDGNLILHSPVFQISVENVSGNGVQQSAILPVQTVGRTPMVMGNPGAVPAKASNAETVSSVSLKEEHVKTKDKAKEPRKESEPQILNADRNVNKKSPGRPRKNGSTQSTELKCDICGQEFNKQTQFRRHMEHHAEEKPHRCPKCPASFNIPTNFTLHMATHNTGEPKCPECGKKFARMASLKSHMLLHEKEENLFCTECEDAFSTKAQLDAHLKLHGEKWATEDVRKCKLCNKQFVQPALYRLHIREHYRMQTKIVKQTKRGAKHKTMYKCTICLKSFQKPSQLMRHIRVHTGEKPFKCTTCGRAFTQKGSLQIHTWQHNGIRPHTCTLCNAKFSQKGNLNAHILRVHNAPDGEPIYGCAHCSCVFKKLGSLNGHMKRMHSHDAEEAPAKCDSSTEADMRATVDSVISQLASLESNAHDAADSVEPARTTESKNDILQQALKNSGLSDKNKNNADGAAGTRKESEAKTSYVTLLDRAPDGTMRKYLTIKQRCIGSIRWYACNFCHKEFKKPSDLIRHLRVHTQEKPFKCPHCFRSFALKSTMRAHERTHFATKKFPCGTCGKTFACHASLSAHSRLHAKPHRCPACDKAFGSIAAMKVHATMHARDKPRLSREAEDLVPRIVLQEPLVISDAGNKISVAHVPSRQGQIYNSGDAARPHKCWVCHAAFRKVSHLKQHYRRHTGERPFKCPKCDRRFSSNSVLKSHLHTHDDARPYSCAMCNTRFSTQSSMKRHMVTHSNKRPFMCPYCHKTFKTSVNCRKHMKIHKHELAQQQLEQQKTREKGGGKAVVAEQPKGSVAVPANLTLPDDIEVSFQPQMAPDFTQAFSDQFQNVEEKENALSSDNATRAIVNQNLPQVGATDLAATQTLHADETGTITIPNYSGDQTLTPESIREIEETLNQQLFSIGMNLGLGSNLSRPIEEANTGSLETREQPVLNIIYENNKNLDSSGNAIFAAHFDSFDMSQITLQADSEMDIGLNATNSTSMSSILPRSTQEARLAPVPETNGIPRAQAKSSSDQLVASSEQNCSGLASLAQTCPKFSKIVEKAHTTDETEAEGTADNCQSNASSRDETPAVCYACDQCNETFADPDRLKSHAEVHGSSGAARPEDSQLQCHICGKRGFTTSDLKEHLKTHRGTKEYQCAECSLRFCTNGGLSRHMKMHTSKQQWKCSVCHKVLSSKAQLRVHSKSHDGNWSARPTEPSGSEREPLALDEDLPSVAPLDVRIGSDSSVSEKVLLDTVAEKEIMNRDQPEKERKEYTNKCKYCPKTFRKPSDLIRHIRTHTGERPYKCDYCSKSFAVKCTLDSHTKVHTGKKTFCCHVCSSLFATKGSLKVHMRLHTGSKPFRCPVCDLRFRTSGHRKVHMLKHGREYKGAPKRKQKHMKVAAIAEVASSLERTVQGTTVATIPVVEVPVSQTIEYSSLDAINIDTGGLTNQITFNPDGTILNNNSVLSLNESSQLVANLHFLLANGLVTIQADEPLIATSSPPAELVSSAGLETVCTGSNGGQIVIAGPLPEQTSQQPGETVAVVHASAPGQGQGQGQAKGKQPGKTPSKKECDICGKTFTKPYQVERHKRIHTGERPFKCELCTKSFAQKSTLQMHQKHHTGDRPHPCPHCEYSFTQKGNLQTHLRRVHQLETLDARRLRRGQQVYGAKVAHQDDLIEAKILNLDDIAFVEFLK